MRWGELALEFGDRRPVGVDVQFRRRAGERVTPRGRLAWAHAGVTNPSIGAVFQTLPGSSFTINGTAPPTNAEACSLCNCIRTYLQLKIEQLPSRSLALRPNAW